MLELGGPCGNRSVGSDRQLAHGNEGTSVSKGMPTEGLTRSTEKDRNRDRGRVEIVPVTDLLYCQLDVKAGLLQRCVQRIAAGARLHERKV